MKHSSRKYATLEAVLDVARELEMFEGYRIYFEYATTINKFRFRIYHREGDASVNRIIYQIGLDIEDDDFAEELGYVYSHVAMLVNEETTAANSGMEVKQNNTPTL